MGNLTAVVQDAGERLQRYRTDRAKCRGVGFAEDIYPLPEQERIGQYAEAFYGLARLFQELPCQKERLTDNDMEQLFAEVRAQVCAGCGREELCWGSHYFESCRMFYEVLQEFEAEGACSGELQERLAGQCARSECAAAALYEGYGQARETLLWSNRMMEQRMAAGEQIYQTAELLRRTASGFAGAPGREQKLRGKLRRVLKSYGIEMGGVRVFPDEDGRMEIYLTLRADRHVCVSVKSIGELLSECCKVKMCPSPKCRAVVGPEMANFHFVPETRYQIFCGISRITKAGELVSGDNYAFLQKDTGRVVMSLADGMGSGVGACRESEKVIELLEQFLEAGFPQETAVRMINSCMLLQNGDQMFSTIDLCMVDLYNAKCDMIKFGAAATFLKNGNEVEVIRSKAFPAGVMQQSDYESMSRHLAPGSTIVMMTDGVLEALPEEGREQLMADLIGRTWSRNAKEHARRLMERIYLMQEMQARDDMTILIGTIWEK